MLLRAVRCLALLAGFATLAGCAGSCWFCELLGHFRVRDSHAGFGVQPSWPMLFPPLAIPIDHCLVSPRIQVHRRPLGRAFGSDHRPVIVDFSLRGPG